MSKILVATFNANSIRARLPIILDWLRERRPDVLCVQETKVQDNEFPAQVFFEAGYTSSFFGQKSYNGVAMLSREPLDDVLAGMGDGAELPEQARLMAGSCNGIRIVTTYVPQGFEPGSDKFEYKLAWMERLRAYFASRFSPEQPLIWCGDINVAPEPEDVYDPVKLEGSCGVHPDERAALRRIMDWGFEDVFRRHEPGPGHYTFWDYRLRGSLSRNLGWRIDHIFATRTLAERCSSAFIDIEPRKMEKPSDHTFLAASFDWDA